jgi:hypothetical protein
MAIRCQRCGREYDVTLFQFGRTIHCACGSRVRLEDPVGLAVTHSDPRFMVDAMLGGLARWLRILGFPSRPGCGRTYWEGSHTRRMRQRLRDILGDDAP